MNHRTKAFMTRRRSLFGLIGAALAVPTIRSNATPTKEPSLHRRADGLVHLPARAIAAPGSISQEARDYLAHGADRPYIPPPAPTDIAGWRRVIAAHDKEFADNYAPGIEQIPGYSINTTTMGGVTVYVARAAGTPAHELEPHFFIHGGGWTRFSGKGAMLLAKVTALQYGGIVYGVDYRMPPDHPFPVPLEDCLAVYRDLIRRYAPGDILVSGSSAGSNLAAALMHKARDSGLPPPGALFLNTPPTDLTGVSDSLQTNDGIDVLLKHWSASLVTLYANGADLDSPYLSPLKGDLSRGFPPTYLRTGTRDLFLSDTVRMHAALRKAGVKADLYVGEAMPHSGLGGRSPEDAQARADTIRWLERYWL